MFSIFGALRGLIEGKLVLDSPKNRDLLRWAKRVSIHAISNQKRFEDSSESGKLKG